MTTKTMEASRTSAALPRLAWKVSSSAIDDPSRVSLCWRLWALSVHVGPIQVCDTVRTFTGPAMRTAIFQVDAFTRRRFAGNPAAVMLLDEYPADAIMQAVAAENNLAETAFITAQGGDYRIRWFTPSVEVPLCGHATLASAAVVMEKVEPHRESVVFHSMSGPLPVRRTSAGYVMDFPARSSAPVALPTALVAALGTTPVEVRASEFNYMAL